jgi:hypothetical protein
MKLLLIQNQNQNISEYQANILRFGFGFTIRVLNDEEMERVIQKLDKLVKTTFTLNGKIIERPTQSDASLCGSVVRRWNLGAGIVVSILDVQDDLTSWVSTGEVIWDGEKFSEIVL